MAAKHREGNAPITIVVMPALSVLGLILLASGLAAVGSRSLWRACAASSAATPPHR